MQKRYFRNALMAFSICSFFLITTSGCGMSYNLRGSIVDSVTGEPIAGAAVAVNWIRYKIGPPGLPTPKEHYGSTETLSDVDGSFKIPNYPFARHYMGVYKKGYICWSSDAVFNPNGKTYEEMYPPRIGHRVQEGMIIKLDPNNMMERYIIEKHATFTDHTSTICGASSAYIFGKAIEEEVELVKQILRRK